MFSILGFICFSIGFMVNGGEVAKGVNWVPFGVGMLLFFVKEIFEFIEFLKNKKDTD